MNKTDAVNKKIEVGDKILHFAIVAKHMRPTKGIITRFTKECLFYCRKGDEKYHSNNPKCFEKRVVNISLRFRA